MKKVKTESGNSASPKVVAQLWDMIDREDIASYQKSSIFFEMMEYRKMNEELTRRNTELIEENATLVSILGTQKENLNNSGCSDEALKFDIGSRISSLNYEIRRLNSVIHEMEKRLARVGMFRESKDMPSEGDSAEKKHSIADDSMVTSEVYKKIIDEYGDLRAKMAGLESKHEEELCEKDQKIAGLTRELCEITFNAQEVSKMFDALKAENEKRREILCGLGEKEMGLRREMDQCLQKLEKVDKDIQSVMSGLDLWMKNAEQLAVEKEELSRIVENYKRCERVRNTSAGGAYGEGSLEEEIINLVESLDKSLGENKALIAKLENMHKKNRELENEMIALRMTNADLGSKNTKLELDAKQLRMEGRGNTCRSSGDSLKIKKLEDSIAESSKLALDYKKRLHFLFIEKEENEKILERIKRQSREARDEVSKLTKVNSQIEAENKRLNGILRAIQNGDSEGDPDLAVQLERYRGLLRCSLCDTRFKDTAIIKCMHCFCEECVNSRIRMRDRRCPSCNESFAPCDVRKIFL
ncbi:hypothetical protein M970_090100 [Encephalitozoon cuniculi EcunIII-L]|uniref:E3 ubiquitin protein ligase n=1 Tax=Encephalitozoon cuniculi TaxID=6035 RepID=M1KLL6_ENCCN|nr:hypothetical protein ECU09_0100 [Encephalitozoon cuniculi]KMV65489.1 hypothetical protein M970_090100 [Encephalitozoon cuniculi EcunIII-L]UYI26687.1 RING-HC_BRE1_like domain-containing protein [Encephalitozoon cuniculi]